MIVLFQCIASYVSFFNKIQLRKNFFNQGEELKNMPRFHLSVDGYWLRFFLFSMLSSYFNVLWWWSLFLSLRSPLLFYVLRCVSTVYAWIRCELLEKLKKKNRKILTWVLFRKRTNELKKKNTW